jgi:hypothetical protein
MNDAQVALDGLHQKLELQTTHPHRGDNVTAAAKNSAPALTLGCASCFENMPILYRIRASWHRKRLRRRRNPGQRPPGAGSRCTDIHANTAGLHASAAMGLSGRLEFDSSNHGLC